MDSAQAGCILLPHPGHWCPHDGPHSFTSICSPQAAPFSLDLDDWISFLFPVPQRAFLRTHQSRVSCFLKLLNQLAVPTSFAAIIHGLRSVLAMAPRVLAPAKPLLFFSFLLGSLSLSPSCTLCSLSSSTQGRLLFFSGQGESLWAVRIPEQRRGEGGLKVKSRTAIKGVVSAGLAVFVEWSRTKLNSAWSSKISREKHQQKVGEKWSLPWWSSEVLKFSSGQQRKLWGNS